MFGYLHEFFIVKIYKKTFKYRFHGSQLIDKLSLIEDLSLSKKIYDYLKVDK